MIHQKQHFPFDRLFDGDSTERLFSSIAGCFPIRHKLALCRQSTGTVWHSENPTRLGLSPESRFSIVENEIYVSDQICAFADQIIFFFCCPKSPKSIDNANRLHRIEIFLFSYFRQLAKKRRLASLSRSPAPALIEKDFQKPQATLRSKWPLSAKA